MEKKQRVHKGRRYWYIIFNSDTGEFWVNSRINHDHSYDEARFCNGNYFHTEAEAESMARKLRAVFAGADVIETPSEEEIKERIDMIIPTQPVESWCVEGYCKHIIEFILSKIIK